ncbi:hypothetical protein [Paenibacillus sp. MMS18-CY102]|uniref:hypothetical protein n=1 Tax=Paenibacillus sp. MMS18-CY102 TaxID=2682849 RepID=UPI0013654722|nr:hypothetical protein [Paenibacillus sp. MMS18-CY102]MWC29680.1 hypothetical protein [Paenibacillus sp. MMS18-CY102]
MLPSLPLTAPTRLPDFNAEPIALNDFNIIGKNERPFLRFGDSRKDVDTFLDGPEFNYTTSNFGYYFDDNDYIDEWDISLFDAVGEPEPDFILRTNKGIIPGVSTLSDVLQQYGTFGYWRISRGVVDVEYYYEKHPNGSFHPVFSILSYYELHDEDDLQDLYKISFDIDSESLKVNSIEAKHAPSFWDGLTLM